jgi:hypothetical protein
VGDNDRMVFGVGIMVGTYPAHIPHIPEPAYASAVTYCVEGKDIGRCFRRVSQSRKSNTDLLTSIDLITSTTMLGNVGHLGGNFLR